MTINFMSQQPSLADDINNITNSWSIIDEEEFSPVLLDALRASAVIDILDVNRFQGPGTSGDVLHVCQMLGKVDASLAWIVGVSNSAWVMRNYFQSLTDNHAIKQNKILSMVLGRPGSLRNSSASSNYILNGEWRYASGWKYASYFFCLAAVEKSQEIIAVAVPAEKMKIAANWNATGLRATQSVTITAHNIEIPANNMEDYTAILLGKNNTVLYSGLFTGVLMCCLLGAMLGATEAALSYVITALDKGPIAGSTYQLASDSGALRAEIGRLHNTLNLYQLGAKHNAALIDETARNPNARLSIQNRVENRGRAALIMRGCVEIVQDLLWIYGSSGLDKGCVLEKVWRDVNVGARHGGFSKLIPEEATGYAMLGRDPVQLTRMF